MNKEETEATIEALKKWVSEGRTLLQDMKAERRETQKMLDTVREQTRDSTEAYIAAQVKVGLADYKASLERATDSATKAVFKRFDTLADILMGTDDPNKESLATVIRKWKASGN